MPVHSWQRAGVRENMETATQDVWLGHALPNAKSIDVAAVHVSPSVQSFARRQKDLICTFLIEVFKDHVPVAAPLVDEAVFIFRSEERRVGKEWRSRWS